MLLFPKTLPLTTDSKSDRLLAAGSYLGLLLLPALYAAREEKYIAFHANQGLTLCLAELLYLALLVATGRFALLLLPWRYYRKAVMLLCWALLAPMPFCLLGAAHALAGKARGLPIIGWIRLLRSSPSFQKEEK